MSVPSRDYAIVLTTAANDAEADAIAAALVERGLAACVQVVPGVRSVYRWKGEICRDEERLLVIKTARDLFPRVRETVGALHSYELPESLLLPIDDADPRILEWFAAVLAR